MSNVIESAERFPSHARYDQTQKNITRKLMFGDIGRRKSVLTMPGADALCMVECMNLDVITTKTTQQWVERNRVTASRLKGVKQNLGFSNASIHHGLIESYTPTRKLDFINIDLEGTFTENFGTWVSSTLVKHLCEDASMVLWVTAWARNATVNDFHSWLIEQCKLPGVLRDIADRIAGDVSRKPSILYPMVLLECALRDYTYLFKRAQTYRDRRMGMVAIRIDGIRPKTGIHNIPSFGSLIENFRQDYHRTFLMTNHDRDLHDKLQSYFATIGFDLSINREQEWVITDGSGNLTGSFQHLEGVFSLFRYAMGY